MRALIRTDNELAYSTTVPRPVCDEHEVLVEVIQAGICETDLQLAEGYLGFQGVLGHEFVGIARSGPNAGQRVVGEINCNCRGCPECRAGLGNHCPHRTVIGIDRHDGAFADFVAVPQHNLHEIPDSISNDQAVLIEPLAAAFQVLQQVPITAHHRVAICGDGRLALMCAKVISLTGAELTVVGKHREKLARFQPLASHTQTLNDPLAWNTFDVVIDCSGSPTGLPLALQLVRPRGTVVMKTTVAAEHQLSLAPLVIDEITLLGSRCGPFPAAISALAQGQVDVDGLITHRFPIDRGVEAMTVAASPEALKVVLAVN